MQNIEFKTDVKAYVYLALNYSKDRPAHQIGYTIVDCEKECVKTGSSVITAGFWNELGIKGVLAALQNLTVTDGTVVLYLPPSLSSVATTSEVRNALEGIRCNTLSLNQSIMSQIADILQTQNLYLVCCDKKESRSPVAIKYYQIAYDCAYASNEQLRTSCDEYCDYVRMAIDLYNKSDFSVPEQFSKQANLPFFRHEKPTIYDYVSLVAEKDEYSNTKREDLLFSVGEDGELLMDTISSYLSRPEQQDYCLRWYLRGLSLNNAIRKTLMDTFNVMCGYGGFARAVNYFPPNEAAVIKKTYFSDWMTSGHNTVYRWECHRYMRHPVAHLKNADSSPATVYERVCPICGKQFRTNSYSRKYCCDDCRDNAIRQRALKQKNIAASGKMESTT